MYKSNLHNIIKIVRISFLMLTIMSCKSNLQQDKAFVIEQKVDSVLALMTLDEKIGQMSQIRHFDQHASNLIQKHFIGSVIHTEGPSPGETATDWQAKFTALQKKALATRLGIPLLFAVDAVHGQNTFNGATIFPHNIGLGATRNPDLVQKIAEITALETQATGFNWTFSPCIAIPFNEKWGRVYEAFSEDTKLTNAMTKASIRGYQGDLSQPKTVMATAKHFVGDGATDFGKEGGNTSLSMQEISNRLLPPYHVAVKEKVGAVMVSFNTTNNKTMHAHKILVTDSLKIGMNFDGIVVSDWKGFSRFGEHEIINAGVDMAMAVDGMVYHFQKTLKEKVLSDRVPLARINDAVKRILRQKFRLGLFKNPFPDSTLVATIGSQLHRNVARKAVRESLVLLKNTENILPIKKSTKKIVVVGEHANNTGLQSGGWTIAWQGTTENYKGATTILKGIQQKSTGIVVYDKEATGNHFDADVAIVVVGETPYAEFFGDIGDGTGTYQLTLSQKHQNYINRYVDKGVPVITVLISGRPLVTTKQITQSNAFVAAWLPGSEGDGIAEVLFGEENFTGKLPHSWPKSIDDFNGKYGPNFWDQTIQPLYPFGFGLQYKNIK